MQNTIHVNGYYGCALCYHPGKLIKREYPIDVCNYNDRTNDEMLQDMVQAVEDGWTVRGVKGPSTFVKQIAAFSNLLGFPSRFYALLIVKSCTTGS